MNYTQEQIIELAKNVEIEDGIDWDEIPNVSKDHVYQIVGSQAYDLYQQWDNDPDELHAILLSTVIKLLVENFVLNIRVNSI